MAFVFKVEDGTGYTDSNSLASIEDADDYLELDIHEQTWPGLEDEVKEKLLAFATRDLFQRLTLDGCKTISDSALPLPRTGMKHANGVPVEVDEIPTSFVHAVIEYARILAKGPARDPNATQGLRRIEVDVIELEFEPGAQINSLPDVVSRLIRDYAIVTSDKPTFAKIKRS
ncbi:DnaT-like ssDNA-binding protein [Candidatus Macondimonas diazotrophica]|jgi:N-acetylglutamate synthase/N-acetylornithine aminotransferase|uniref:Putative DnaT-like domain-containing protein n=1 Tax=Candidatus Macondimonas diazotrophica TaxID=2305248 RepID=A0A4Z0F813_9GAMM|nr:DnaT-like ssDNA-binding protein [Candidatus Macondimonas diazotrophica]TFZ81592.1 hypothetical protein E4680_11870 [Candidatus Macondimonas diazotrophica]